MNIFEKLKHGDPVDMMSEEYRPAVVELHRADRALFHLNHTAPHTVDGKVKFACVDGPEFDGHLVNFDEVMKRMRIYKTEEGRAYLREKEGASHHGGCGHCSEKDG